MLKTYHMATWSWEHLEGTVDGEGIFTEPILQFNLGRGHVPIHMVHFPGKTPPEHGEDCWLIQDERGFLWKASLHPGTESGQAQELLYMHNGVVTASAESHSKNYFATVGEDGNVRIYNNDLKLCVAQFPGESVSATAVIWIHPLVSGDSNTLVVGYGDGTLKVLELAEMLEIRTDVPYFFLKKPAPLLYTVSSRRVQRDAIVQMVLNEDTGLLAVISSDSSLLILSLRLLQGVPMALYKIKWPTNICWKRTGEKCEMLALITTGAGIVYEVLLPTDPQEATLVETTEGDAETEKLLTPITELQHRMFELKSIKSHLQSAGEAEAPLVASRIVWGMYDFLDGRKFWITTTDFDAGFIYLCTFGQDGPTEPIQAVKVDPFVDLTVRHVQFLDEGHLMLLATTDGQVQIFLLRRQYKIETRMSTWSFKVHDGLITGLHATTDFMELFTSGTDGNVLNFRLNVSDTATAIINLRFYKDLLFTIQTAKLTEKEERELDIFLKEDRRMREQAERDKDVMAEKLEKLKTEIRLILQENEKLPKNLRLAEEEFVIHPDVRTAVEGDFSRRIFDAQNVDIVERVKGHIIVERLLHYFRGSLEPASDFKLKTFDSLTHISTYWIQKIESDLLDKISQLTERNDEHRSTTSRLRKKEHTGFDENFATDSVIRIEEGEQTEISRNRTWERWRYEDHLARAKRRRQYWQELINRKPNVTDENDRFLINEQKRISGQEYKIKQNVVHAIQFMAEYLKAPQVELEFLRLRQEIYDQKKKFNSRLEELRAEKLNCIRNFYQIKAQLEELHKQLPEECRLFLASIHDLDGEEVPDHCPLPTREECWKIYQATLEIQNRKEKLCSIISSGLEPFALDQALAGIDKTQDSAGCEKKHRFARLQSFATRQGRCSILNQGKIEINKVPEETPWDDLKYEISEDERKEQDQNLSSLLYQQEQLIQSADDMRAFFDGKLRLMRHDKFSLDIELKRAEMHLFIYQWEHHILQDQADREQDLSREEVKLLRRQDATERRIKMLEPDVTSLQEKLKLLRNHEDRIKNEFETHTKNLLHQKKFHPLLHNIFNKNIKGRAAATATDDDDEDQPCIYRADEPPGQSVTLCSISSVDFRSRQRMTRASVRWSKRLRGSSLSRGPNSQISFGDFDPTDIYVCPRDLDKKVFKAVHVLNKQYQRVCRDIEDEIHRNREIMEISCEAREELSFIEFELADVSGSLHDLRLQKFNQWKNIPFPVAIRMNQVQFLTDRVRHSDLSNGLVFNEQELGKLSAFIDQVRLEIVEDSKNLQQLKQEYEQLDREQIIYTERIDKLRNECHTTMLQNYGEVIDLDLADSVRVDPQIQEIRDQLSENQAAQDIALGEMKKEAAGLRVELTKTRAETTVYLKTIAAQMTERDLLMKRTTRRADKIGRGVLENVTIEDLRSHQEKLEMWRAMAETQEAEIAALLTEISFFKRKDTDVSLLMQMLERRYTGGDTEDDQDLAPVKLSNLEMNSDVQSQLTAGTKTNAPSESNGEPVPNSPSELPSVPPTENVE